jgi:hypothetical protein
MHDDLPSDQTPIGDTTDEARLELTAYAVHPGVPLPLIAAPATRDWMDQTSQKFANRCLPMLISNQAGWLVLNPHRFLVTWTGGETIEDLQLRYAEPPPSPLATSHFGHGILTISIPYVFKTPPGYNLQVRGPANAPKDAIAPLEGIVETDWTEATFTMNWKMTRPTTVAFDAGEPIAMIVPQLRGELECQFASNRDPLFASNPGSDSILMESFRRRIWKT